MRQGQNSRRSRGRGNNSGRRQHNVPLRHQTFDSNGPDVRIRGNAFQVYEKYLALARDAQSSGDRIAAENYLQHAEHYYRIIEIINEQADTGAGSQPRQPRQGRDSGNGQASGNGQLDEGEEQDSDDDQGAEDERAPLNA